MENIYNNLNSWFENRPFWLQEATKRIITHGAITDKDINELTDLCISEVDNGKKKLPKLFDDIYNKNEMNSQLSILSISNIQNINALSPRNPLDFGTSNLAIVYGENGTGKSGYTRILKHICGAKKPGKLLRNAFSNEHFDQKCTIKYKIGDEMYEKNWDISQGIINDLNHVEIYDTDCAFEYVNKENEVSYEPWVLSLFSRLIETCSKVQENINIQENTLVSKMATLPKEYKNTESGKWYSSINYNTAQNEVDKWCNWNEDLEKEENTIKLRLAESNPLNKAQGIRNQIKNLNRLYKKLTDISNELSQEKCKEYLEIQQNAISKRKIAKESVQRVFSDFSIEGIDSDTWRILWEKAREFSESYVYVDKKYPNTDEKALCVLCHQPLDDEAKNRFITFEEYIKGSTEVDAAQAEKKLKEYTENLSEIPNEDNLKILLDSAGIIVSEERELLLKFVVKLTHRREALISFDKSIDTLPDLPDNKDLQFLKVKVHNLEEEAVGYEADAKGENRTELVNRLATISANRWLFQQKQNIIEEIITLRKKDKLNKAKRLANTQSLSTKKSTLSMELITDAYVDRFRKELKSLNATHLKIELTRSRTYRGQVLHEIKLRNSLLDVSSSEVLSEGEQRIVSLAAFLADVEGRPSKTPFVFDDPISSLDLKYEEATIKRLIELCRVRQVIVFTHRISLVVLINELAKKIEINEPKIIGLRKEIWGAGEPGDTPLIAKNTEKALNKLLNHNLTRAKKALYTDGEEEYVIIAKGICAEFRENLERTVESVLLDDIVRRFRKEVQTRNRIHKLTKIQQEDCDLIEGYMTKYSQHVHSQSLESPIDIPRPEVLEEDITDVLNWIKDFKKR